MRVCLETTLFFIYESFRQKSTKTKGGILYPTILRYSSKVMAKKDKQKSGIANDEKKIKLHLGWKMVLLAELPLLMMAIVLTIFSVMTVKEGMQKEAISSLRYLASSVRAAYDQFAEGDYYLAEDGSLMKGELNVSERTDILDAYVADEDADVTMFYGDVRKSTTLVDHATGERIVGTTIGAEVSNAVLSGSDYKSYNLTINGEHYYAYYEPLYNGDGSVVGMVFVGMPAKDINEYIQASATRVIVVALLITLVAVCVLTIFGTRLGKAMRNLEEKIREIASGNLAVEVDAKMEKRADEVGMIMYIMRGLLDRLNGVMGAIKNSALSVHKYGENLEATASQTSSTSDEIAGAVEGISKGAVSQAEDIEQATVAVADMGKAIEDIVVKVENLTKTAEHIKEAGDAASSIMAELSTSNDKTTDAVKRVAQTVQQTDESVQQIREAVAVITSIASETSLLSLNASIEAARAGEAGRGFAVVASEIQKLAEESNQSAQRIEEIINKLLEDSRRTMDVMSEVNTTVDEQQKKLEETKEKFGNVSGGIDSSRADILQVTKGAKECDKHRTIVVDIIQNLSAVSEENAASAEETTASMQELNATINLLAQSAQELLKMSEDLNEETTYFTLK